MLAFILSNLPIIIPLIITLVTLIYFAIKKDWVGVRKKAYELVLQAEGIYNEDGQGDKKFQYVMEQLYKKWPILKCIPEKYIKKVIEKAVEKMKDYLKDGKIDGKK
jgi:hypothetical protein